MTAVDGRLFIFGGQEPQTGVCFNDVVVYDPALGAWHRAAITGGSPPPRHSHTACVFQKTRVLVYGGAWCVPPPPCNLTRAGEDHTIVSAAGWVRRSETGPSNEVWVLDTETLQWSRPTVKGQSPAAREMHAAVHVEGVGLVIHGGRADGGAVASDVHVLNTGASAVVH
jgi:hypothetical protein